MQARSRSDSVVVVAVGTARCLKDWIQPLRKRIRLTCRDSASERKQASDTFHKTAIPFIELGYTNLAIPWAGILAISSVRREMEIGCGHAFRRRFLGSFHRANLLI